MTYMFTCLDWLVQEHREELELLKADAYYVVRNIFFKFHRHLNLLCGFKLHYVFKILFNIETFWNM